MPVLRNQAYNKYAWTILNQTVNSITVACALNGAILFSTVINTKTIDADEIETHVINKLKERGL